MSLAELSGHRRDNRITRLRVKQHRTSIREAEADEQIRHFLTSMGEPSEAFFPETEEDLSNQSNVIFLADAVKARNGDLAKRRGDVINTVLENPQAYPITKQNMSFVERHFPRIYRFAHTARNKGRLNPKVQEILGL